MSTNLSFNRSHQNPSEQIRRTIIATETLNYRSYYENDYRDYLISILITTDRYASESPIPKSSTRNLLFINLMLT